MNQIKSNWTKVIITYYLFVLLVDFAQYKYRVNYTNIFHEIDGSLQIQEITEKIKQILKKS